VNTRPPSLRDFSAEEDRLGFFGPDSVTWRLHADPSFSVAGIRALMLQALHPVAMDGVDRFSAAFTAEPWARLTRTAEYVATLTYGTRHDALRAVRRVRGLHRRFDGVEETTGRRYRVDDPDLLLWVHACEVDSFLSVARRAGVPLTDDEADRYVAEQVVAATLIGVPQADVPATEAALTAYVEDMRPVLAATPAAREAVRFIIVPPMPRWVQLLTPARPAWGTLAALGLATLPRWARRMFSLPGLGLTDAAATAGLRAFRSATLAVPPSVRENPVLQAARQRVGEIAA
jgi:uncharacterized protein (DUF2236 family)